MKKNIIILLCIVTLAAILRLWGLGSTPPSPNWDEVALGYNAYSIRETGKDEYGVFLPTILRSYDDYKPALYTYFVIPSISIFGLNASAVRLPSAIFGTLTVLATYFLVKELFSKHSHLNGEHVALVTAFLLAISPWHIQFSRVAYESNVGLACNVFGVLFFLKGLKKPWMLTISAISFAAAMYVYQSEKVFTPLLAFVLFVTYGKELFRLSKKSLVTAALVGLVVAVPMFYITLTDTASLSRARGVSVFSNTTQLLERNVERLSESKASNDVLGIIFNNRRVTYVQTVIANYLSHFDPNWLFITGDLARHHAPNMGLLYLFEIPFVLIGLYTLVWGNIPRKTKIVIFAWMLIAPIPASITSGVPHAVRTLNFLPTYQIITALGILATASFLKKYQVSSSKYYAVIILTTLYFILTTLNIGYYLNQYFVQQNYLVSQEWQYGYKEAVSTVKEIEKDYDEIVVSNRPHMDQSYMFFLFYLQYPPGQYQTDAKNASGGFRENHSFGKYTFRPIEWDKEKKSANILYIGRPEDFPSTAGTIKTVNFLDGQPAIKIVEGS